MPAVKKTFRKGKGKKSSPKKKAMKAKPTKTFKKKVIKVINSQAEVKYVSVALGISNFNSAINGSGDIQPIFPPMAQGVKDRERIGSKVNMKYLKFNISISQAPYSLTTDLDRPVLVRLLVLQYKRCKYSPDFAGTSIVNDVNNSLLQQDQSAPAQPYDGTINKALFPLNTDLFTKLHDISFPLLPNELNDNVTNTQTTALGKNFKIMRLMIAGPKQLVYGEDNNLYPNNFAPFFCLGYSYPDGSVADVLNRGIVVTWESRLAYTDE